MAEVSSLIQRVRDEFAASEERLKQFQQQQIEHHREKERRLVQLEQTFNDLRSIWQPRLEALVGEFGEKVQVTPSLTKGLRQATMEFASPVASITLQFSAATDDEVTKVILSCDLDILPILMQFEKHAEISFPIDQVDQTAVGQWLDDRIVQFVRTYLSLHHNEYYLKHHMVEDPIAHVRFPKFAAGATRQSAGKTVYFISEETAKEFDRAAV